MVLLIASLILVMLVYGRYGMHYIITKDGILAEPAMLQVKTNRTLNALTLLQASMPNPHQLQVQLS